MSKLTNQAIFSEEFNAIFENAAVALFLIDQADRIVNINRTGSLMIGKKKGDILGLSKGETFHCAIAQEINPVECGKGIQCELCTLRNSIKFSFATKENRSKVEGHISVKKKSGTKKMEVLISTAPIKIKKKEFVLVTIEDVTQLKKQQLLLKEINSTKDKFFSIIAHDLKNPFAALIGSAELMILNLKKENCDPEKVAKHASKIFEASVNGHRLLENLLEWSHAQIGSIVFNPKLTNINDIITESISALENCAQTKKIKLNLISPPDITVYADPNMISTVLRNLISNAIKFSHPGAEVTVSARKNVNHVELSIKDSGIGIPQTELNRLFKIDQKYSILGTNNETGTGLGLILCKEFVEKHSGKIWAQSECGKGSEFKFTLQTN
ncbi:MAG: hypothetical protein A3F72_20435 [Bacteroidetes bacterium RIFCSPLOWO2_12_FULL_35_15]|nr:MAG: hypothetical protein A3F72_20435 [Bacteroidetes bacterium RIFCSPLOWO2_12_FULL_35_15]